MKKILSLLLTVFILSATLCITSLASEPANLFDVEFDSATRIFSVTAGDGLVGENRVLLVVKNSNNEVIYMDTKNNASKSDIYFGVKLGKYLEANGEYTFIFSSDGDTVSTETETATAVITEAEFFNVEYSQAAHSFVVTGEIKTEDDKESFNRILLMVYDPMMNGYSDLYYMDALNGHKGEFEFTVPLTGGAPIGTYTFVISSDGDVVTKGSKTCAVAVDFETYGTLAQGTKIGATYTMHTGETAPTVIVALYKDNGDGSESFVRAGTSSTVVDGRINAEIELGAEEDISGYRAKAFVWDNTTNLMPLTAGRSFN